MCVCIYLCVRVCAYNMCFFLSALATVGAFIDQWALNIIELSYRTGVT